MSCKYFHRIVGIGIGTIVAAAASYPALAKQSALGTVAPSEEPLEQRPQPSSNARSIPALAEVVVTATHIERPGFSAPTPTTSIGKSFLEDRAPATLIDALALLPESRGASTPTTAGQSAAGSGGESFLNLRGLGPNRTLVLLDGQRLLPTTAIETVDIALLPQALIKRVDLVTGGASATYGSDAVAGAANFVLDTAYTGLKLNVEGGDSSHNDAGEGKASLVWGHDLGQRLHVVASGEFYRTDGLGPQQRDFDLSQVAVGPNPNYAPGNGQLPELLQNYVYYPSETYGGLIVGGPLANTQFLPGGATGPFNPCPVVTSSQQICSSRRTDLPWGAQQNYLASPDKRGSGYLRISHELSSHARLYVDGLYGSSHTTFTTVPATSLIMGFSTIKISNAFLPQSVVDQMEADGITSFKLGRFSIDNGPTVGSRDASEWRTSAGIDAELGGSWKANSYVSYGKSLLKTRLANTPITANFNNAVDSLIDPATGQPVCRSTLINPSNGCVPVDLFGFESPSAAAMGYYLGTAAADLTDRQVDVAVNFSGNLFPMWDGPASLAAGGEYRSESLAQSVDPISLRKGFAFSNPQPLGGSMSVSEGYVETVVPLARNRPFAKNLELDVAGRVTRYNTSGTVETWKLGLNYAPVRDFRLRLTRSRDIRAPNITELDSPLSETTAASPVVDPLNNRAVNVETFSSGNRDLVPEIAYTGTAGLVFEPTQVKGLSASLDYYHIDVGGGITTLGLQSILNGCHGGDAQMCSAITRNASGQLISIDSAYFNLNRITTSGLDFDVEYRTELSDLRSGWRGVWELRALGNEIRHYYVNTGTSTVDYVGDLAIYQIPKWSWDLSSLYSLDGWTGLVDATYLSGGKDQVALDKLLANNDVGGVWYLDTGIQKSFVAGPSEMTVYLNIRNLLNREPPFAFRLGGGINGGPAYDRIGRYFKLGIRVAL